MKVPSKFKLYSREIKVEFVQNFKDENGQDSDGEYYPEKDTIILSSSYPQKKIEDNFFHEFAHALMDVMGREKEYYDEQFCETLGNLICQLLRTKK